MRYIIIFIVSMLIACGVAAICHLLGCDRFLVGYFLGCALSISLHYGIRAEMEKEEPKP